MTYPLSARNAGAIAVHSNRFAVLQEDQADETQAGDAEVTKNKVNLTIGLAPVRSSCSNATETLHSLYGEISAMRLLGVNVSQGCGDFVFARDLFLSLDGYKTPLAAIEGIRKALFDSGVAEDAAPYDLSFRPGLGEWASNHREGNFETGNVFLMGPVRHSNAEVERVMDTQVLPLFYRGLAQVPTSRPPSSRSVLVPGAVGVAIGLVLVAVGYALYRAGEKLCRWVGDFDADVAAAALEPEAILHAPVIPGQVGEGQIEGMPGGGQIEISVVDLGPELDEVEGRQWADQFIAQQAPAALPGEIVDMDELPAVRLPDHK